MLDFLAFSLYVLCVFVVKNVLVPDCGIVQTYTKFAIRVAPSRPRRRRTSPLEKGLADEVVVSSLVENSLFV